MSRDKPTVRVKIVKRASKPNYILRWIDPDSGAVKEQSSGIAKTRTNRRDAERKARDKELEIEEEIRTRRGTVEPEEYLWLDVEIAYCRDHLAGLRPKTAKLFATANAWVNEFIRPNLATDVTSKKLRDLVAKMRSGVTVDVEKYAEKGKPRGATLGAKQISEASIASYMRALRSCLNWAFDAEMIPAKVKVPMPKRISGKRQAKARPVTGEEFDRLCASAREKHPEETNLVDRMKAMFWGGFRLGETFALSWDADAELSVVADGLGRWLLKFSPDAHKSAIYDTIPAAPEFCRMLDAVPARRRRGLVYPTTLAMRTIARYITEAGVEAKVKVNGRGKYATAHDLRRSFATRWAPKVQPAVLQRMMRHSCITTTLTFYVDMNASELATVVHAADGRGDLAVTPARNSEGERIEKEPVTSEGEAT